MESNGYCAVNTKYYKDTNADGEIGHILRVFKKNSNTYEELTPNNFGFVFDPNAKDLKDGYDRTINRWDEQLAEKGKRKRQKKVNTYIDSCLILDRDITNKLIEEGRKDEIKLALVNFMNDFKGKYGFEPVGFELHCDEGHIDENGVFKHNYHAHALFCNYDFKSQKSPLRKMKKVDWSNSQDLLYENLKHLGYKRGKPKEKQEKDHSNKIDYLNKKIKGLEGKVEELAKDKEELQNVVEEYSNAAVKAQEEGFDAKLNNEVVEAIKEVYETNKGIINKVDKCLERQLGDKYIKPKKKVLAVWEMMNRKYMPVPEPIPSFANDKEIMKQREIDENIKNVKKNKISLK